MCLYNKMKLAQKNMKNVHNILTYLQNDSVFVNYKMWLLQNNLINAHHTKKHAQIKRFFNITESS